MTELREVVIVDAVRTPTGKRNGQLSMARSDDMLAVCLKALVDRTKVDASQIEDVVIGCNTQFGDQAGNLARIALLEAGYPISVAGVTLNRFCASGMTGVQFAASEIMTGNADLAVGGGVENMSKYAMGVADGVVNSLAGAKVYKKYPITNMGLAGEAVGEKYKIPREQMDKFALWSHQKAVAAQDAGYFNNEIVPVPDVKQADGTVKTAAKDEGPRRVPTETSLEKLAKLPPAFKPPSGKVTAGNSSSINDQACALLLASREKADELGLKSRATIKAMAVVGVDPVIALTGPAPSSAKALKRAGLTIKDMDALEVNEAFASVCIATGMEWGIKFENLLNDKRYNPCGGAIALGHPLGCSGARLITTQLNHLERINGKYGLATLCVGMGQGIATIIEREK
ncbi:MAG: thiolase family protein [Candidatus Atabeyarchaeum deiterrae]